MDIWNIERNQVNRNTFLGNVPTKIRLGHITYSVSISALFQFLLFSLILSFIDFFNIPLQLTTDNLDGIIFPQACLCAPFIMLSVMLDLIGGDIGYRFGRKNMGAILGAVIVQVVNLALMINVVVSIIG
jgi:hypothetical protein